MSHITPDSAATTARIAEAQATVVEDVLELQSAVEDMLSQLTETADANLEWRSVDTNTEINLRGAVFSVASSFQALDEARREATDGS